MLASETGQTGQQETGQTGQQETGQTGQQEAGQTGQQETGQTGQQETGQTGRRVARCSSRFDRAEGKWGGALSLPGPETPVSGDKQRRTLSSRM